MQHNEPGREPTDAPVCGATTVVDGKFRTCELPKGHTSDHRTTLRGIEIWWPVDEPAALVIGSNQCEHGHLARVCVHCELIAAEARVAELEAHSRWVLIRLGTISSVADDGAQVRRECDHIAGAIEHALFAGKEPTDAE